MQCKKCGDDKREDQFYTSNKGQCKACIRRKVTERRNENIEYARAYDKQRSNLAHRVAAREKYAKTEQGKAATNRAKQAYINRNPIARAAHQLVGNAIKSKRIFRRPCEVCGKTENIEAHHDDYTKPLEVRWLCIKHHVEWHRNNDPFYG